MSSQSLTATLGDTISNVHQRIIKSLQATNAIDTIILLIIFVTVGLVFVWLNNMLKLSNANCQNLEEMYGSDSSSLNINNINQTNPSFKHSLASYYIKTAYNCCCAGSFKNDFVDSEYTTPEFCALRKCIQQGARCLDFEIYSYEEKPVIAASSLNSDNIKETFNYLDFDTAMYQIAYAAFSSATCTNNKDPLILNLRIMSKNKLIYPQIAASIFNNFKDHLLDAQYNLMNYCKNLGLLPLTTFIDKIIVIIDNNTFNNLVSFCPIVGSQACATKTNSVPLPDTSQCQAPNLLEVCNMHSGSNYINTLRVSDITANSDLNSLKELNKTTMTILLPDYSNKAQNINPSLGMNYGCQMVGMCFQNFDSNMEFYTLFFNKAGSAFALKTDALRFIQKYITLPPPPPSYIDVSPKTQTLHTSAGPLMSLTFPANIKNT